MYADDSRGLWFYNQPGGAGSQQDWVTDEMDWGAMIYNGGAECTNWQLLVTPPVSGGGVATPGSFFTPYINSPSVYKCPADPSMALAPNAGPRARRILLPKDFGHGSSHSCKLVDIRGGTSG